MSVQKTGSLFGFTLLLLAGQALHAQTRQLAAGQALVFEREDKGGLLLTSAADPLIRLVEVEGAEVVVRLTPIDRAGLDLGSGRVIVVGPAEERTVRLRDEFVREGLYGVQLRVEVLQGAGRVMVTTTEENGRGLQPQADPTQSRIRAVRPPGTQPTSLALIDKAEAAGALDGETALLYRVYALFSDARLPAQYRGDDSKIEDSLYMAEVRDRFATLSPATQSALLPFLTPPAYQGSWANAAAGSSLTILETPLPCQFFSGKWGWVDTSNNLVRVWYRVDLPDAEALRASSLAQTIDTTIWPALSGLMKGHLPLSDLDSGCNGGNGRLDIYLVDVAKSFNVPQTGCSRVPVFILLKRTAGNAIAAHEIFHAFQFSFPLGGCLTNEKYLWWGEASAEWAQDFVFPSDQQEHSAAPDLLGAPEQPLDLSNDRHWYGAYLLPFFVQRKTGSADFVRLSWELCEMQPALEALDQAIGGLDKVWPEFVKANWNREPIEDYKKWDLLFVGARASAFEVNLAGLQDKPLPIKVDLPRLSATYKYFKFDDTTRSVAFWNGVTFKLSLDERQGLGVQYQSDPASADEKKGARVQALIKLRGQDWQIADWTNRPYVSFCRDVLAERIDELVLIISNSEFKTRDRSLFPPALAPLIWVSNMGCWRWKGTATYTDSENGVMVVSTNVTWTRPDTSLAPPFVNYKAEGTLNWSSSGVCTGSGTLPILTELSTLFTFNFTPTQGSAHRSYFGLAIDNTREVPVDCGTSTGQLTIPTWFNDPLPPFPGARFLLVNANGTVMDGSFRIPDNKEEWKWHFEAEREP